MAERINRVGVSSLASRAQMVVEPSKDSAGDWYWALMVEGGIYADGTAENRMVAQSRAVATYNEWLAKQ